MNNTRTRMILWVLFVVLLMYPCWTMLMLFTNYSPVSEAVEEVRRQGSKRGYQMKGGIGDITSEPNDVGACEVVITFRDYSISPPQQEIEVRARRAWAFGKWELLEVNKKPIQ